MARIAAIGFVGGLAIVLSLPAAGSTFGGGPRWHQPDAGAFATDREVDYDAGGAGMLPPLPMRSLPVASASFESEAVDEESIPPAPLGPLGAQPCRCWRCARCCELGDPWRLPQPGFLERRRIAMGGWIQQGITANALAPDDRFNGPLATNDRAGEYQLNQLWLFFDRPVETGAGWDWGGRVDVIYGTDWRFANSLGLENRINGAYQLYGMALPQFYLDVARNNLTVRLGRWAPSFGHEIIPSVANFFYSHAYGLCYNQPLLVTGVMASYQLTERWSVKAGTHRGSLMFEDPNDRWDFLGGMAWTSPGGGTELSYHLNHGPRHPFLNDRFVHTFVWRQQLSEDWTYVLQNDLGTERRGDPRGDEHALWYGLTNHLIRQINPRWSAGVRVDFFRDERGAAVAGCGNAPETFGWDGGPGFAGTFTALTMGLNWRPHANVVLRPEVRWDWYGGSGDVAGNLPFGDGARSDQFTFATDLVVTF